MIAEKEGNSTNHKPASVVLVKSTSEMPLYSTQPSTIFVQIDLFLNFKKVLTQVLSLRNTGP